MTEEGPRREADAEPRRAGLPAPVWMGLLTVAILALLAFLARASFAA